MHALRHPVYAERYQRNKKRLGRAARRQSCPDRRRQKAHRGDLGHMLTNNQPFAPTPALGGAANRALRTVWW